MWELLQINRKKNIQFTKTGLKSWPGTSQEDIQTAIESMKTTLVIWESQIKNTISELWMPIKMANLEIKTTKAYNVDSDVEQWKLS